MEQIIHSTFADTFATKKVMALDICSFLFWEGFLHGKACALDQIGRAFKRVYPTIAGCFFLIQYFNIYFYTCISESPFLSRFFPI